VLAEALSSDAAPADDSPQLAKSSDAQLQRNVEDALDHAEE
jgi:hypothetical protein